MLSPTQIAEMLDQILKHRNNRIVELMELQTLLDDLLVHYREAEIDKYDRERNLHRQPNVNRSRVR